MSNKQPQNVNIDISNIPNLKCECGGEVFVQVFYIKIVSAIMSPTGKEVVANVQDLMCDECGKTLNDIMTERKNAGAVSMIERKKVN